MKFAVFFKLSILLLTASASCLAQDPLPVLKFGWQPAVKKAQKAQLPQTGPAKLMTTDDTMIARTNREARTDHPDDPSQQTPDGRRAMIEKNEQEAQVSQPVDMKGFNYTATVRNDAAKTVKIIFWQYRFAELAHPENVRIRQFLCSVNLKKGAQIDLSVFSMLAPTDTIAAPSLALAGAKLFDEKVQVNRIEYADDDIMQRGTWKLADVQTAVTRATATPWGKETCRPL